MRTENDSGTGRNMRLRPHKRWDDEGVASTVGTIMAMMVFLSALSMFTSQYVPIWMEENEASHMSDAYGQFAALKQAVDMQILAGTIQGLSPVQMFSPVKLGANGIPMFAAPTPGYLSMSRMDSVNNASFTFNNTVSAIDIHPMSGGAMKLNVPNRYFTPQTLVYEGGALILKQPDGEYMKGMPQLIVTRTGSQFMISFTQVDLRGDDFNYVGYGTRGVQTTLLSVSTTTFNNLTDEDGPGNPAEYPYLNITQTTFYGQAWAAAFDQIFSPHKAHGLNYNITTRVIYTRNFDVLTEVTVRVDPNQISRFTLTEAIIQISTAELGAE